VSSPNLVERSDDEAGARSTGVPKRMLVIHATGDLSLDPSYTSWHPVLDELDGDRGCAGGLIPPRRPPDQRRRAGRAKVVW
jgi:hypothetical protein